MVSQALIIRDSKLLMVKQYVSSGRIVWNFPGGGMEGNEAPEEACIREVKEETGYDAVVIRLLNKDEFKYTFIAEIIGGELGYDQTIEDNDDLLAVSWISLNDVDKFDGFIIPLLELFQEQENRVEAID
ncbi:NUDIX domain-containing protein [Bacillus sp. JJ1122]|uniref:NUDIX hydrolase n=1 Tax=Bacillus sp. JJ1122 TaxID=3122951 RepID=UPI002FFEFDBC